MFLDMLFIIVKKRCDWILKLIVSVSTMGFFFLSLHEYQVFWYVLKTLPLTVSIYSLQLAVKDQKNGMYIYLLEQTKHLRINICGPLYIGQDLIQDVNSHSPTLVGCHSMALNYGADFLSSHKVWIMNRSVNPLKG